MSSAKSLVNRFPHLAELPPSDPAIREMHSHLAFRPGQFVERGFKQGLSILANLQVHSDTASDAADRTSDANRISLPEIPQVVAKSALTGLLRSQCREEPSQPWPRQSRTLSWNAPASWAVDYLMEPGMRQRRLAGLRLRKPAAHDLLSIRSMTTPSESRVPLLRRAVRLEWTIIVWNILEGLIAVWAGLVASSIALLSFGIDSFIEVSSAAVVLWRLRLELGDHSPERAERREQIAAKIAGALLLGLAAYIVVDGTRRLAGYGQEAEESLVGIALTAASLVAMPLLGWAKLQTADRLGSRALRADSYETITCAWLSLTTLLGLSLNATLGWTWADPVAALLIVPLVVRESLEAWRGEDCHSCARNDGGD